MFNEKSQTYIERLPIGQPPAALEGLDVQTMDIDNLPSGLVTGSNLIQFSANTSP